VYGSTGPLFWSIAPSHPECAAFSETLATARQLPPDRRVEFPLAGGRRRSEEGDSGIT
jgi:hypothetical protein